MSTTIRTPGRLGNYIIRNIAISLLAEKYNLYCTYGYHSEINKLGIILFCGKNNYKQSLSINNNNYLNLYNSKKKLEFNLNPCRDYFQTEQITNLIHNYLKSDKIKNNIININKYSNRYNYNNDLFIHIRLSDAKNYNVGINYYLKCINNLKYNNIYVASVSLNDNLIKNLIKKYPKIILINYNEIDTIHFGSTCKYIILSHGTFSAIIGYLAFYSIIYYPNSIPKWCPIDLFTNKGWNGVDIQ